MERKTKMMLHNQCQATQSPPQSKLMRIPVGKIRDVLIALLNENDRKTILCPSQEISEVTTQYARPLYSSKVAAGFPSPASDHQESAIDLHCHLVALPASTFFVKATGESMINAHIHEGDLLIVDRSLPPQQDKIVIAALNSELTVKRLKKVGHKLFLMPDNPKFTPIEITEDSEFTILGTVTHVIHTL